MRFLTPNWPAPPSVRAISTFRGGGVSIGPYASFNLATHVGDDPEAVRENRRRLRTALDLQFEPLWLEQVHGIEVIAAHEPQGDKNVPPRADASVCKGAGRPCVILTADCLPVLLCDRAGSCVGAAHAGWRGLVGGVLATTVAAMGTPAEQLMAWLGPAIEPDAFEVGEEVRKQFIARDAKTEAAFEPNARGRWQADLHALARLELASLGVHDVYSTSHRCFAENDKFFSYRREGKTGRMATMGWVAP